VKTFSFLWTARLRAANGKAAPKAGCRINLVTGDRQKIIAAVNHGIDAYLEACFVPGRGDGFRLKTPHGIRGKFSGPRLEYKVSRKALPVLVRWLMESDDESAESLGSDICQTFAIELV